MQRVGITKQSGDDYRELIEKAGEIVIACQARQDKHRASRGEVPKGTEKDRIVREMEVLTLVTQVFLTAASQVCRRPRVGLTPGVALAIGTMIAADDPGHESEGIAAIIQSLHLGIEGGSQIDRH